ncbi:hypothetical protein AB4Z50_14590 [Paenibacillus sp. 2TAB26]|uniref:hypothetical protein n=1 Tax=Paenibacillus sp. 2TAB26 TaxID=3233005 RepID=UPI003F97F6EF
MKMEVINSMFNEVWRLFKKKKKPVEQIKNPVYIPPRMKMDCDCSGKVETRDFDKGLGCWYVTRECEPCEYYWEGPIYMYDDPARFGSTQE